jgi:CDP-glycerol glycerophosphotransferase (TagB/SpsB family)
VYNVRAFLDDSIRSILDQDFDDFELILVDDCSTDGSSEMLLSYSDPRLSIVRLPRNSGLGPARNAGVERARGTYLLFLDSDDALTAGSLTAIRNRIAETNNPQVLLFDYARWYWDGSQERNVLGGHISAAAGSSVFTLADHMDLLDVFNAAWSKAYHRDFINETGLRFPPGYYEDLPWTLGALMMGQRLAALDRVVVLYRQRVAGSILRSQDRRHFEVFDQWRRVFQHLADNPGFEIYRAHLHAFMISQFDAMLVTHGRVPDDARAEFFAQAHALCQSQRPADWKRAASRIGRLKGSQLRLTALDQGNLVLYEGLAQGKPRVDRIKDLARVSRTSLRSATAQRLGTVPERAFRRGRTHGVDPRLAVFSSYWHRTPACNPLAISRELAKRAPEVAQVWVTHESLRDSVPPYAEWASPESTRYGEALARAGIIVNNVNLPNWMQRRADQVYLQTQHGTPLKFMALDMRDKPAAKKGFDSWPALMQRIGQWSHCLSSNRYSTLVWERSMPGTYEMWELGYPRNDILVNGDEVLARRVREALGIGDRVALLYMPTLRDYGIVPGTWLDLESFSAGLPDSHVLLVRGHYLEESTPSRDAHRMLDVSDHPSVEELMLASDVLITDYSSAMFDYANTGRPILNYCADWDAYRMVRGTYFDLATENPGGFCRTQDHLLDLVTDNSRLREIASSTQYEQFRTKYCQFDDGHAAERVVEHLLRAVRQA